MSEPTIFQIKGKIALITGAGRGLGRGYAIALGRAGCKCICIGRTLEDLAETKRMIEQEQGEAETIVFDITQFNQLKEAVDQIEERFGPIDILVNNAGTEIAEPFLKVTEAHYDMIMDVNIKAVFFLTQAVAEKMKARKRGKIINIGSLGSVIGLAGSSVYCSSKGAITQLTKTAALELASEGIQVNAIFPGYFLTEMTKPFFDDPVHKTWIEDKIPLGRVGTFDDLVGALLFLAAPASDYMTGQSISVDGGWTAG
ncbi:glucose 1-dehydrogenase [Sporolactobacillus shoreicorticis]|uniref:SDR family NAD(P)-dependent oxidoreductase n=1 Tax=Sporolactobacillus shoreicorticis TaxID=1923877 RepID=A0ABW5S0X3_9BACL|nr:glucose 1-dehydrogenase [Sporolactobacillus shoreicorticis]MCO7125290.1 glucose 1-dehydrogenase [Sporolactobacillus shoreicorticis]